LLLADFVPWLCWLFPILGAVFALLLVRFNKKLRDAAAISFSFLGLLMATFLLPELFSYTYADKPLFSIALPAGNVLSFGLLVDPLSIILVNLVAFVGFLIMVYSLKYMENDAGLTRFWFLMSLFIGSMLLLILADNLILLFIGWKIVSLCSFALIGYYYGDEKEHWVGGPAPFPFQKPSKCGLKALIFTTFGDTALLAAIIILYIYSGTFNLIQLYQTASIWLPKMAQTPGMLTLTSLLFLGGPLAKSAQFPFHEWLPEAMAGPTPVSALIHAATMVKAGVYLVARMVPVFYYALWVATPNYPEASMFFFLTAALGVFTAFMTATQGMVAKELKKALAYSTMNEIGFMMLALGVSGLSPNTLVAGVSSGIFFLISHGIFKAALFMGAGVVIHFSGSIYLSEMHLSRKKMWFTWLFMWIAALSLIGVPPFAGFWSKDDILIASLQSGQYVFFILALATVAIGCFYAIRFMGLIFHGEKKEETTETRREASKLELAPYGILAALTVAIGSIGPWVTGFLQETFRKYYAESLNLVAGNTGSASVASGMNAFLPLTILVPMISVLTVAVAAIPAYRLYVSHKTSPENVISSHISLKHIHRFLWNRWYIDAFYNKVFANGTLAVRRPLIRFIERPIDYALNEGIPKLFVTVNKEVKKLQTGILSVNILYMLAFLVLLVLILLLSGVI
jgi:NADH-quinone oxidoreductase subunit L